MASKLWKKITTESRSMEKWRNGKAKALRKVGILIFIIHQNIHSAVRPPQIGTKCRPTARGWSASENGIKKLFLF